MNREGSFKQCFGTILSPCPYENHNYGMNCVMNLC